MTVADYILQRLVRAGVTHVFGLYGAGNAYLFDAFTREPRITMIPTAGEQGAGFAAEGYSKARGGALGVCVVTSGPGALNAATSVANCFYDSVPVLFLCGQVSTKVLRRSHSLLRQRGFQECPTAEVFKPIAKMSVEVTDGVAAQLDGAIAVALQGRPGPVVLSLPLDILGAQVPELTESGALAGDEIPVDRETQALCLAALAASKRPVILAGGGCVENASDVRAFAERFDVPVFTTWNALEVAPYDWSLCGGTLGTYGGGRGRNFAVQQADFVLALGTRLSGRLFGGRPETFLRGAQGNIWHVDVDSGVLTELQQDLVALQRTTMHSYVGEWLRAALDAGVGASVSPMWLDDVRRWRDTYDPGKQFLWPYTFVRELSKFAQPNAVVVSECGGNAVIFHQAWEAKLGQRIFSSHGGSAMGQGLGLAIGAAVAEPDRPVIALIGDGGFTLAAAELNTIRIQAARLRNLRMFVLNNGIYGITRAWQRMNLDGRVSACGPDAASGYEAPNVEAVCGAYGVRAAQIALNCKSDAIESWVDAQGPLVVDVLCPGFDTYKPRVTGWDRPIEEMLPSLPAAEFLAQMKYVEPVEGWEGRRQ